MNDNLDKNLDMENLEDSDLEQVNGGEWGPVIRRQDDRKLELGFCYKDNSLLLPIVRKPGKKVCICSECGTSYRKKIHGGWEEEK